MSYLYVLAEDLYLVTYKDMKRISGKKGKWMRMADKINKIQKGQIVTADQCRLKIKALKEKFKRKMERAQKSGAERVEISVNLREAFQHEFDFDVVPLESSIKGGKSH